MKIEIDEEQEDDGCQQSHNPRQKLRIEQRILALQQHQQMVAAAGALGKSATRDVESAPADLASEESHNRHAPPKTPAERREQLCFGAFKGGRDDFRWAQRLGRSRHQQTLMRVAQAVNAKLIETKENEENTGILRAAKRRYICSPGREPWGSE